ncbi:MAG: HRDC domain-containing protein, partial [Lentisphaerota bacterium]
GSQEELLKALRELRSEIARKNGHAPYLVFPDRTLCDFAVRRPDTPADLLSIHGVGAVKMEKYGSLFLSAIRSFVERHPSSGAGQSTRQMPLGHIGESVLATWTFLKQGLNGEVIANRRGLSMGTIACHVECLIQNGFAVNLDQLVPPDCRKRISELLGKEEVKNYKQLVDASGGNFNYGDVRMVHAWLRKNQSRSAIPVKTCLREEEPLALPFEA